MREKAENANLVELILEGHIINVLINLFVFTIIILVKYLLEGYLCIK